MYVRDLIAAFGPVASIGKSAVSGIFCTPAPAQARVHREVGKEVRQRVNGTRHKGYGSKVRAVG